MIHPFRILVATIGVMAGMLFGSGHADASISCPQTFISTPNANYDTVAVAWGTTCNDARWYFHMELQYELNGSWIYADCVNSHPCDIIRPLPPGSFYPADSSQGGTLNFDVIATNGCGLRWRARQFIGTPNPPNPHFTLTGPPSSKC